MTTRGVSIFYNKEGSIGVGSLIIFISMILVAGVVASVLMQTMNNLQQQALRTSQETIADFSNGLKVTHISGYHNDSKINKLAVFVTTTAGSSGIDLSNTFISLSDSKSRVVLNYESNCFSSQVSNSLFDTLDSSNLSDSSFGLIVIRDIDSSCTQNTPVINDNDLVAIIINTTACFSGLNTRTEVTGYIVPEKGIRGIISFDTPSSFYGSIIELQG